MFIGISPTVGGEVRSKTVVLTAADLAVLDSVPFELVAAPGAGKALAFNSGCFSFPLNGGVGGTSSSAYVQYGASGPQAAYNSIALDTFIDKIGALVLDAYDANPQWDISDTENVALVLKAGGPTSIPGAITTSSLNDGGVGYVNGDTFTVDGGLGTLATGTVTNAVAGVVQPGGYTLDTTPNGYLVATGVATTATSGIGTGLFIDIDTLDYSVNPMTLTVKTLYSIMRV